MRAGKIAVAFLKTKNEPLFFAVFLQQADLLANELETGQRAAQLHAVLFGDGVGHVGGHDGGVGHRIFRQRPHPADVIQQQHAHLVTGQQPVAALAVRHRRAHAVAVRVGAQHQVGVNRVAQAQAGLHGLADLRVGVRAGGKIPVRLFLLGNHRDVLHPHALQQQLHRLQTAAVQRGVHQFQFAHIVAGAQRQHRVHKIRKAVVLDGLNQPRRGSFVIVHKLRAVKIVMLPNGGQHLVSHREGNLAAVRAVDLVAVVLGRVVAGRNAHPRPAAQIPYRPGKRRGWLQPGVQIRRDAVGRQHPRGLPAEQFALAAAVVGQRHLFGQAAGVQIIRQPLGGPADRVNVQSVGTRAQYAPQPAGAEFQIPVKPVGNGVGVLLNGGQLGGQVGVVDGAGAPQSILFLYCHSNVLHQM